MFAQTGPGIGIYPTGTEAGLGYRSARDSRWAADVRITRTNLWGAPRRGSLLWEASAICRVLRLEKVRFHLGLGTRLDLTLNPGEHHKAGAVAPIGVEAFPFPFQNAGLFFESAPFFVTAGGTDWNAGIRTVAGFIFYFPKALKYEESEK